MKKRTLNFALLLLTTNIFSQGNHVFSGGEAANHGVIDLATPGGQSWSTDRASLPGYFSGIMGASFTGASDAANINGYVKKYGNESFTFPVGTGTDIRTVLINNNAGLNSDAYSMAWIVGDPSNNLDPTGPNMGAHSVISMGAGIVSVSPIGQWDWEVGDAGNLGTGTTGTGLGLPITVSIPDMSNFATIADLRLVGWNGTQWIDLSGGSTANGNTENSTLTGSMVAGITAIAIGSTSFILPVKLVSFSAKEQNCMVEVSWITAEEINSSKYELEQSTDGIYFNKIATVNSRNADNGSSYFTTIKQQKQNSYYRLKMVDKDGRFEYSGIISLRSNCSGVIDHMNLYPNPVTTSTGQLTLEFNLKYTGNVRIAITNSLGQELINQYITIISGVEVYKLNSNSLQAGVYYLQMIDASGNRIGLPQKFIKQ